MAEENVFTRKLGPLPMWAWLGIGLGGALAFSSWNKNKQAAQQASQNQQQQSGGIQGGGAGFLSGLIPQFVNQNYTNDQPPVTNAPTGPKLPQVDTGVDQSKIIGNRWDTITNNDKYLWNFVNRVYGTPRSDTANMAINIGMVQAANPQINFNRPLVPGTAIFAPGIPK